MFFSIYLYLFQLTLSTSSSEEGKELLEWSWWHVLMYILGKHSSPLNPDGIRQVGILLTLAMLQFIRSSAKGVVNDGQSM